MDKKLMDYTGFSKAIEEIVETQQNITDVSDKNELLTCPFCGYIPEIEVEQGRRGKEYYISCDCGCEFGRNQHLICGSSERGGDFTSKEEAIAAWNKRR